MLLRLLVCLLLVCGGTVLMLPQTFPFPGPGRAPVTTGCTTPTGTNLTESFGDASTSCWTSGPSTCDNTWTVGAGTLHSIVSSPGTPDANTACGNSLQMSSSASSGRIYKSITGKGQATAMDLIIYTYVTSHSIPSFDCSNQAYVGNINSAFTSYRVLINLCYNGNTFYRVIGTASVDTANITVGTWNKLTIHLETGTNASSVTLNAGSPVTFTQAAQDANYIMFGNGGTYTYVSSFGYAKID